MSLKLQDELDTASSLKALMDCFVHWSSGGLERLPIALLCSTLKAVWLGIMFPILSIQIALLSDLFNDVALYATAYDRVKAVFASEAIEDHPTAKGYAIYILLKCTSVVDWVI